MFVARGDVALRGDGGEDCGEEDNHRHRGCFGGGVVARVGLSQAEAATSGIWKKKRTLPLLLPPRDGAEGVVDDGGDGDGNDGDDGVARSKGGVVASVVIVIDDDDDDNDNDDDDDDDGGDGEDDGVARSEGGIIASIVVVVDDDDDDDDDDGVAQS